MRDDLDLERFPLDDLDGPAGAALIARCRDDLERFGTFELDALVRPPAVRRALAEVAPVLEAERAGPPRRRPVFPEPPPYLPPGHPALAETEDTGRTVGLERLGDSLLARLYRWPPLSGFLARVLGSPGLHPTETGLTVSRHAAGESAGWCFGAADYEASLLLQAPQFGGNFEIVRGPGMGPDSNAQWVADLLAGRLPVGLERLMPGTLHVLRGSNFARRITTVGGDRPRVVAGFAFEERPPGSLGGSSAGSRAG